MEQANDLLPVEDNVQTKKRKEEEAKIKVKASPVMAIPTPKSKVNVPAILDPAFFPGDEDKFHQKAKTGHGHQDQEHQGVNDEGQLGFINHKRLPRFMISPR